MPDNEKSNLDQKRHSLAHLLAMAVLKKYPKAKLGIGPTIEDGFYYDFDLGKKTFSESDLKEFESTMRELVKSKLDFKGKKITPQAAKKFFKDQPFKFDLIKEYSAAGKELTAYETGSFTDLCKGGHVKNTSEIDPASFTLTRIAGAYWHGDEKNPQLQRIYAVAFDSKEELAKHLAFLEETRKRDHKKLGIDLDLFTFSDLVGPGLPLWTPKGTLLRTILDNQIWELRKKQGYEKVEIPHITKKDLYEKSGHWEKFKDELFRIKTREGHDLAMKPMNCPHHTQIFARRQWSYRELPQRYANTTMVYRDEQSGELAGLSRARSITQDDAHVFCRLSQTKDELLKIWDIIHEFYGTFGFILRLRLSLHDLKQSEKYLGDLKRWKEAEDILRDVAKTKKAEYVEAPGEAAFYGPKLDFLAKDSLGREWQVATIQLDMNMPERFGLYCINESGEHERIVMIHAAIMGSIERFLSIVIEHYAGAFPLWLAPVQVKILTINDRVLDYAKEVLQKLYERGIRTELDLRNESIGKKIREGELQKIPYLLVIGEKEVSGKTAAVRERGKGDQGTMGIDKVIEMLYNSSRSNF